MLSFSVPGDAVPKGRPRFGKGRIYTPPRTAAFERKVALYAKKAKATIHAGPLSLTIQFFLSTHRVVDLDNLLKACMDALNGVVWIDDSQIEHFTVTKYVGQGAGQSKIWVSAFTPLEEEK